MHIIDVGEVVISVPVRWIDLNANFHVLVRHGVLLLLEVRKPKVVLELSILRVELT